MDETSKYEHPTHVTIGKARVKLGQPPSLSSRFDIVSALGGAEDAVRIRYLAAALSLCWEAGGTAHPPARYAQCKYSPTEYGRKAMDELLARKVPIGEIAEGGQAAFLLLADGLLLSDEVEETANFTEGQDG